MPWLRTGDHAATYPRVMAARALGDDRIVNELFGFFARCMAMAAGHMTDYVIDAGTVFMIGGARTEALLEIAERLGLIKLVVGEAGLPAYQFHDDPEFLHMRLKAEVEWERQRKRDTQNPSMSGRVRLRDGDECRWCGVVTFWGTADQKSARVGNIDHLQPGKAGSVATMVVSCRGCNTSRQDDREGWVTDLRPAPAEPFYSEATAQYIEKHLGQSVPISSPARPGALPDTEPERPVSGTAPTCDPIRVPRSEESGSADLSTSISGSVGSGRVGSGRAETGRDGPGQAGRGRGARGRRSRRGGR